MQRGRLRTPVDSGVGFIEVNLLDTDRAVSAFHEYTFIPERLRCPAHAFKGFLSTITLDPSPNCQLRYREDNRLMSFRASERRRNTLFRPFTILAFSRHLRALSVCLIKRAGPNRRQRDRPHTCPGETNSGLRSYKISYSRHDRASRVQGCVQMAGDTLVSTISARNVMVTL